MYFISSFITSIFDDKFYKPGIRFWLMNLVMIGSETQKRKQARLSPHARERKERLHAREGQEISFSEHRSMPHHSILEARAMQITKMEKLTMSIT